MGEFSTSKQSRLGVVGAVVAGREVVTFFLLTLALSWTVWAPSAMGLVDLGSLTLLVVVVGAFGPLVAAALVTWLVGDSLRDWVGQVLRWRVRPRWYVAALGVPLLAYAATSIAYLALGNAIEPSDILQQVPVYALPLIFVFNMVFVFLLGGGQEELGWRGFALPRLLERFDAVTASLVIGVVWAVWHLPLFMMDGASQYGGQFVPYAVTVLGLSILFTWLYRGTGHSVLLAMILHASHNSATILIPFQPIQTDVVGWLLAASVWVLALGLVAVYGRDLRSGGPDDRETVDGRVPPTT